MASTVNEVLRACSCSALMSSRPTVKAVMSETKPVPIVRGSGGSLRDSSSSNAMSALGAVPPIDTRRVTTERFDRDRCLAAVAHTPPGGYGDQLPPEILAGCRDPLPVGAPDLRGLWQVTSVEVDGLPDHGHRVVGRFQRIEQSGDRIVVTGGGVVHDMRCDGTVENGVHDVAERDYTTPITVVATYEDGVHVLRPVGMPIEVRRRRDADQMVWDYVGFTARLDRIGDTEARPPADPRRVP